MNDDEETIVSLPIHLLDLTPELRRTMVALDDDRELNEIKGLLEDALRE